MSCCCFDQHGHASTNVCLTLDRVRQECIYSGPRPLSSSLVCVCSIAESHLRCCSTVAPLCFHCHLMLKHAISEQTLSFYCLTRAHGGGKLHVNVHLVLISFSPFCLKHWEGFIISDDLSACVTESLHLLLCVDTNLFLNLQI